jgi:hypothetical protein
LPEAICPYCAEAVTSGTAEAHFCATCGTPHHEDCWQENGGCTVFGCASAPPEEDKVRIDQPELLHDITSRTPAPPPNPTGGESFGHDAPTVRTPTPPPPLIPGATTPAPAPVYVAPDGFSFAGYGVYSPRPIVPNPPKERITYILLGIFLGIFGVHNFYAGNTNMAIAQLCVTLLSCFILSPVTFIWSIVEVCTVDRDKHGTPMV